VTPLSFWFLAGFITGILAGILATDLARWKDLKKWPRMLGLVVVGLVWTALLVAGIVMRPDNQISQVFGLKAFPPEDWWQNWLLGTLIGSAAAPWVWLHFQRYFGIRGDEEQGDREPEVIARAHMIWLLENKPEGRDLDHYFRAKGQVADEGERLSEASARYAELQLSRYRLVSILLGVGLLSAILLPRLPNWLNRAQQIQVGVLSLTLSSSQQSLRPPEEVLYADKDKDEDKSDKDSPKQAISLAYRVGAPRHESPVIPEDIEADLARFDDLSLFDRDRAYIAWITYHRMENVSRPTLNKVTRLASYMEGAEDELRAHGTWIDPKVDRGFVQGSSLISHCLERYAPKRNDQYQFFTDFAPNFTSRLGDFVNRMDNPSRSEEIIKLISFSDQIGDRSKWLNTPDCGLNAIVDSKIDLWIDSKIDLSIDVKIDPPRAILQFEMTPYPTLIAAYYLASIDDVNRGEQILEKWIRRSDDNYSFDPQRGWYLFRAKISAGNLPLSFGHHFTVPRREWVVWQRDETELLGRLLGLGTPKQWNDLCKNSRYFTIDEKIGERLAFIYATERFYLFEKLAPADFWGPKENDLNPAKRLILDKYLHEAKAIAGHQSCLSTVPLYREHQKQYQGYFFLYAAQLGLLRLAGEHDNVPRKELINSIEQELDLAAEANLATTTGPPTLQDSDTWERHRARLNLLWTQLESAKHDGDL
jgi:hypothetical protein